MLWPPVCIVWVNVELWEYIYTQVPKEYKEVHAREMDILICHKGINTINIKLHLKDQRKDTLKILFNGNKGIGLWDVN